jgi:hypothetical protein
MGERRQYHRYLLYTEIEYQDVVSSGQGLSKTKDISRGGLCITTDNTPLQRGGRYRLTFQLPFSEKEISATARVMWHRREGALFENGLTFIDIDDRSLDMIEEYSNGSVEQPETPS